MQNLLLPKVQSLQTEKNKESMVKWKLAVNEQVKSVKNKASYKKHKSYVKLNTISNWLQLWSL